MLYKYKQETYKHTVKTLSNVRCEWKTFNLWLNIYFLPKGSSEAVYFGDEFASSLRLTVGCWCMLGCPWCELLFMWPEDCLMCHCDGVRERSWKEALCSAARSPYTATSCFRPPSSQAAQCTHLASEKKIKTEGFSTHGCAAQDPIHLLCSSGWLYFLNLQIFPCESPGDPGKSPCLTFLCASNFKPLKPVLLGSSVWVLQKSCRVESAVSVPVRSLEGA